MPHALAFNLLGFVLPGLLAAIVAECLRRGLPATAGWAPRVGSQMLLLAGLAFAAMGLLPLDVDDLHGPASQLHASARMIWVLGFVAGTLLLAVSGLRQVHGRALGVLALGCGMLAALAAFALQGVLPAPLAQRLAFACWAVWLGRPCRCRAHAETPPGASRRLPPAGRIGDVCRTAVRCTALPPHPRVP